MPFTSDVPTVNGPVRGLQGSDVQEFRGIPYAGPIGGNRRFRAPESPTPWVVPFEAGHWPPMVPQATDPLLMADADYYHSLFGRDYTSAQSEDGLHLNVWTPAADGARRPVLVFLHGGGFTAGSATRPRENGANLSRAGDLVVVAPNHRLNTPGYLWPNPGSGEFDSNVGMLDIIAALQWVRDNIVQFGGNPDQVTIMGESGGSLKVATLLAMPAAAGLFHRAICQSGAYPMNTLREWTIDQARRSADEAAASLGLQNAADLAALPIDELIQVGPGWMVAPVVDGESLPEPILEAVRAGHSAGVPLLIGTNLHEMRVLSRSHPLPDSRSELAEALGYAGDALAEHYLAAVAVPDESTALIFERAMTDVWFRIPTVRFAERKGIAADPDVPVYLYLFDWENPDRPDAGSTHGMETPFALDNINALDITRGAHGASALAAIMSASWIAFVRTGNPNHPGLPADWPPYEHLDRATMMLGNDIRVECDPGRDDRIAWEDHAPASDR